MLTTRRGVLYVTAVAIVVGPVALWLLINQARAPRGSVVVPVAFAGRAAQAAEGVAGDLRALAERDPLALIDQGRERFERDVRDYRCVLIKQERIEDELSPVQEIDVRVRQSPRAIYMIWKKNATGAKRALYREGDPAYVGEDGQPLARVEPAGAVIRVFVKDIFMPIHGEQAQKSSRRTIDECGFSASFALLEHYDQLARQAGLADTLQFKGVGEVDGRPTFVFVRLLPYTGEDGVYPDARLVIHLDQERLLPVGLESYADNSGRQLLGRYIFTKVDLNPGLAEADFEF